ncbi:unnamed protein product [Prorocentrum cordatum]|uniref:PDZ domain-containing protein n=1 Tax=Prorocentrum cordatum TaxID=2364126 RepID=A0ABN9U335_9DINO|nr:unnamed protein product [Polarella glacialis]
MAAGLGRLALAALVALPAECLKLGVDLAYGGSLSIARLAEAERKRLHDLAYEREFTVDLNMTEAHVSGKTLGAQVDTDTDFTPLSIVKIQKSGLLETWNRANPDRAVHVGDQIVKVNGIIWHHNSRTFAKRISGQFLAAKGYKDGAKKTLSLSIQRPRQQKDTRFESQRQDLHRQQYSKEFVANIEDAYVRQNMFAVTVAVVAVLVNRLIVPVSAGLASISVIETLTDTHENSRAAAAASTLDVMLADGSLLAACKKRSGHEKAPDLDGGNVGPRRELGDGQRGRGHPAVARCRRGDQGIEDGARLRSPGRWAPQACCLPSSRIAAELRAALGAAWRIWSCWRPRRGSRREGGPPTLRFPERLLGRVKGHVFPPMVAAKLEARWQQSLGAWKAFEGRGYAVASVAATGASVGADVLLPRTPVVHERKTTWAPPGAAEEEFAAGEERADDYASVKNRPGAIAAQLRERVAAPGAVQKASGADEWRVVFDATHYVLVNHEIRVLEQDVTSVLGAIHGASGQVTLALLSDVSKAHRRIPAREEDSPPAAGAL